MEKLGDSIRIQVKCAPLEAGLKTLPLGLVVSCNLSRLAGGQATESTHAVLTSVAEQQLDVVLGTTGTRDGDSEHAALPACLSIQTYLPLADVPGVPHMPGFAYGGLSLVDLTVLANHAWHAAGHISVRLATSGHGAAAQRALETYLATRAPEDAHYTPEEMSAFVRALTRRLEEASMRAGDEIYGIVQDPPPECPLTDAQLVEGTRQHRLRTTIGPLSFPALVNPKRCIVNSEIYELVSNLVELAGRRYAYDLQSFGLVVRNEMIGRFCQDHATNSLKANRLAVELLATVFVAETTTRYYCLDTKRDKRGDVPCDVYDSPLNSIAGADCEDDAVYSFLLLSRVHETHLDNPTLHGFVDLMRQYVYLYVTVTVTGPKADDTERFKSASKPETVSNHATVIALHYEVFDHISGRVRSTEVKLRELAERYPLAFVLEGTCDRRAILMQSRDFDPIERARRTYTEKALASDDIVKFVDHEMDAYAVPFGTAPEDRFYRTFSLAWSLDFREPQASRSTRHYLFKTVPARGGELARGASAELFKSPQGLASVVLEPAPMNSETWQRFHALSKCAEILLPPEPQASLPVQTPEITALNEAAEKKASKLHNSAPLCAQVRFWFRDDDIDERYTVEKITRSLSAAAGASGAVSSTTLHEEPSRHNSRRLWTFFVPTSPIAAALAGPASTSL